MGRAGPVAGMVPQLLYSQASSCILSFSSAPRDGLWAGALNPWRAAGHEAEMEGRPTPKIAEGVPDLKRQMQDLTAALKKAHGLETETQARLEQLQSEHMLMTEHSRRGIRMHPQSQMFMWTRNSIFSILTRGSQSRRARVSNT